MNFSADVMPNVIVCHFEPASAREESAVCILLRKADFSPAQSRIGMTENYRTFAAWLNRLPTGEEVASEFNHEGHDGIRAKP